MPPLDNAVAAMAGDLTEWRRDLHAHPELGYAETRTAAFVAEKLRAFGLDEVVEGVGRTGVVGVLHGEGGAEAGEAETILLRADMDALPIKEATGAPWASETPSVMHACGHDGHTTMLLGAARLLAETRAFRGRVVFMFQPAEEGGAGAQAMLDDGLLERWPARAAFGIHNVPGAPLGFFAVQPGPTMAMADEFEIVIRGQGGHAAEPHHARDPIVAGAALVQALQTIISRRVDPAEQAVLSVTTFHAGDISNVIPAEARLTGTVRVFSETVYATITQEIARLSSEIGAAFGVDIAYAPRDATYPPLINDKEAASFAAEVMAEVAGRDMVTQDFPPSMTSEDFAFLARARPAAFGFLGVGDAKPLHHPAYDFPDAALPWGVAYFRRLVERALPLAP